MLLRITDGATTVVIHNDGGSTDDGLLGARYFPSTGDGDVATETITVVYGGSSSAVLEAIRDIKRLLSDASVRQSQPGNSRVYLEYQINSSDDVYRSEIVSGGDSWGDTKQLRQIYDSTVAGEFAVIIERMDFWEGPSSTIASGTIRNGTTSPYNALSLSDVPGSLPTPLSFTIENASGASVNGRNFYLNLDAFAGLTTNQHLLTPSTATVSWTDSTNHSNLSYPLSLSSAMTAKLAGKSINVVAAFSSIPTGSYVRAGLYLYYDGVYTLLNAAHEQYVHSSAALYNLGNLEIPKVTTAGLVVGVTIYSTVTSSATMVFAQIAPSANAMDLDSAYIWGTGEKLGYDAVENTPYYAVGSSNYSIVRASGGPLMAYPGRTNRLHLLFDESSAFNATRQSTIVVSCRPRRRTI